MLLFYLGLPLTGSLKHALLVDRDVRHPSYCPFSACLILMCGLTEDFRCHSLAYRKGNASFFFTQLVSFSEEAVSLSLLCQKDRSSTRICLVKSSSFLDKLSLFCAFPRFLVYLYVCTFWMIGLRPQRVQRRRPKPNTRGKRGKVARGSLYHLAPFAF
jgi:hypothetical protein